MALQLPTKVQLLILLTEHPDNRLIVTEVCTKLCTDYFRCEK